MSCTLSVQPYKRMREELSPTPAPRPLWIVRIANDDCRHLNDVEVFTPRQEAEAYFRETLIWHLTAQIALDDGREEGAVRTELEATATDALIELFTADCDTVSFAIDVVERILDPGVQV